MKATISIIIFLLFYFISVSQQSKFSKVYFDNNFEVKSNGMAKSNDGGLIVCGEYDSCLLYTSDAADERSSVDLGGRRIIKKKKKMI